MTNLRLNFYELFTCEMEESEIKVLLLPPDNIPKRIIKRKRNKPLRKEAKHLLFKWHDRSLLLTLISNLNASRAEQHVCCLMLKNEYAT